MQLVDLCESMALRGAKQGAALVGDSCGLKRRWSVGGHSKRDDLWPVCVALVENYGPNCARVAGLECSLLPFNAVQSDSST